MGVYAVADGKPVVVSNGVLPFQAKGVVVMRRPGTPYYSGMGQARKPSSVARAKPRSAKPAPKPAPKPQPKRRTTGNDWGGGKITPRSFF